MEDLSYLEELTSDLVADEATEFELAPEGTHLARAVGFIQLGTQKQEYQGKPGKSRKKIMITWELPEELKVFKEEKGPEPFVISNIYSLVQNDKSTYKLHVESWTKGKIDSNFNPTSLIGKPCLLTIKHKPSGIDPTKMKAKVTGVTALSKNQLCPDRISPFKILLFRKWDEKLFNEQSEWIRKTIEASPEYQDMTKEDPFSSDNNEGKWTKNGEYHPD